jgi:hypothetical protein
MDRGFTVSNVRWMLATTLPPNHLAVDRLQRAEPADMPKIGGASGAPVRSRRAANTLSRHGVADTPERRRDCPATGGSWGRCDRRGERSQRVNDLRGRAVPGRPAGNRR